MSWFYKVVVKFQVVAPEVLVVGVLDVLSFLSPFLADFFDVGFHAVPEQEIFFCELVDPEGYSEGSIAGNFKEKPLPESY